MTQRNKKIIEIVVAIAVGFVIGYAMMPYWQKTQDEGIMPTKNETADVDVKEDKDVVENIDAEINENENTDDAMGGDEISADYMNATYNFALDYPEGWSAEDFGTQINFSNGVAEVDILIKEKSPSQTLDDYYAGKELSETKTVNGLEARHYITSGYAETEEFYVFNRDNTLFEIHRNFTVTGEYEEIINSFQLF
ncbi:MAG: hypothetical protein ABIE68_00360 [bacterium]